MCNQFVCIHAVGNCRNVCSCQTAYPTQKCNKQMQSICSNADLCKNCLTADRCKLIPFAMAVKEAKKQKEISKPAEKVAKRKQQAYAYVDGSFNSRTGTYGYGGYLVDEDGNGHILQGSGTDHEMASMRNVSGEILGAEAAMTKAKELGIRELSIYYDYTGIEAWVTGKWSANKEGTKRYRDVMQNSGIKIKFIKVKGHSGVKDNERADVLAKEAVGL